MAKETALGFAQSYGLLDEVNEMINRGFSPEEALEYYDII